MGFFFWWWVGGGGSLAEIDARYLGFPQWKERVLL